jgi:hypothetical protein
MLYSTTETKLMALTTSGTHYAGTLNKAMAIAFTVVVSLLQLA